MKIKGSETGWFKIGRGESALSGLIFTICLKRISKDPEIPNLTREDNGLRTCLDKGDFEQSMRVKIKRKWGKYVIYTDDAKILTNLNKENINRIIQIYTTHLKKYGLKMNAPKTEVYVVQEKLVRKVHEITNEVGLKDTTKNS